MKLFIINKDKPDTNSYVVIKYFPSEFISFFKEKSSRRNLMMAANVAEMKFFLSDELQ